MTPVISHLAYDAAVFAMAFSPLIALGIGLLIQRRRRK